MTRKSQAHPPHVLAAKSYRLLRDAKNTSGAGTKRAKGWSVIEKYDGHPDGIAKARREAAKSGALVTKRYLHKLERDGQLIFDTSPDGVTLRGGRSAAIPANYQGTLPERVRIFLEKLVNEYDFETTCKDRYTIRILKGETDFGYFNSTVDRMGGVIGYRFGFPPFPSGFDRAPAGFDVNRFCKHFGCCRADVELDPRTGGRKDVYVYLIFKNPAAATRTLLRNAGTENDGLAEETLDVATDGVAKSSIGAGFGNTIENKLVEDAAISFVRNHYKDHGWVVSEQKPGGCGFDLECRRGKTIEKVEVKGVRGSCQSFQITRTEVETARTDPAFVLMVVTSALSESSTLSRYPATEFLRKFELKVVQYQAILGP